MNDTNESPANPAGLHCYRGEATMLRPGLYEQVINKQLDTELSVVAEASKVLSQYLSEVIECGLDNVLDNGGNLSAQIELTNQIVTLIQNQTKEADFASMGVAQRAEQLLALLRESDPRLAADKSAKDVERPETSIAQSSLFTGAIHEPQMFTELKKEIISADWIDMLVFFTKWSDLRLIIDELRKLPNTLIRVSYVMVIVYTYILFDIGYICC